MNPREKPLVSVFTITLEVRNPPQMTVCPSSKYSFLPTIAAKIVPVLPFRISSEISLSLAAE